MCKRAKFEVRFGPENWTIPLKEFSTLPSYAQANVKFAPLSHNFQLPIAVFYTIHTELLNASLKTKVYTFIVFHCFIIREDVMVSSVLSP
jgi:hypothetical protein